MKIVNRPGNRLQPTKAFTLERHKNELRVALKLEMIGRSVSVAVGAEAR